MKISVLLNFSILTRTVLFLKVREADRLLEEALRLCDTKEYMDTLTLANHLLDDAQEFFNVMNMASRGNFLSSQHSLAASARPLESLSIT
jgi:hypothetical protein